MVPKTALIHHDRFQVSVNQLCIDHFTPDFLREQSSAAGGYECMSIRAQLLHLLRYCAKITLWWKIISPQISVNVYTSVAKCVHMDFQYPPFPYQRHNLVSCFTELSSTSLKEILPGLAWQRRNFLGQVVTFAIWPPVISLGGWKFCSNCCQVMKIEIIT